MARKRYGSRRRRRGRFTFLYKLLSVLIICAAIVAALTLFFKVENIEVIEMCIRDRTPGTRRPEICLLP